MMISKLVCSLCVTLQAPWNLLLRRAPMAVARPRPTVLALLPLLLGVSADLHAQPPRGATPVRFTTAVSHQLSRSVELTGSVESRRSSLVASEVAGIVASLDAREGDPIRKGASLVRLRGDNLTLRLEAMRGQLTEAEARLTLARTSHDRSAGLFDEKIISQQQLDDAASEVEAWQGRVAQLTADVARLDDDLARTTVRAPFSGIVVEEHVAEGEWLSAGDPVVELVDFEDLEVTIQVPEQYFDGLKPGSEVEVHIASLGGLPVEGRIRAVVPQADARARTFPAKIRIDNPGGRIGVGMLAQVELPVGDASQAVMIPKDAIVSQGGQEILFRIDSENKLERLVVATGISQGAWVDVTGSIEVGDRIVTRGNERAFPGQAVEPEEVEYDLP